MAKEGCLPEVLGTLIGGVAAASYQLLAIHNPGNYTPEYWAQMQNSTALVMGCGGAIAVGGITTVVRRVIGK